MVEVQQAKQVCCGQEPDDCMSLADDVNDALDNLVDEDITANPDLFTTTVAPDSIQDCQPNQLRLLCYRKCFRIVFGVGVTGQKLVLPSCIRNVISQQYPDA